MNCTDQINKVKKLAFFFLLAIFLPASSLLAQLDAKYYADIFNVNGVKIELWLVKPRTFCEPTSKDWKFKLKTVNLASRKSNQQFLTWKIKTVNCENYLIENVFSINLNDLADQNDGLKGNNDWGFQAKSIEKDFPMKMLQAFDNPEKDRNLGQYSTVYPPDSIIGSRLVSSDQTLTLKVLGQSLKGKVDWYWYENICGQGVPVNRGVEFKVKPKGTTTYFVRSEDGIKYSDCKYVTVIVDDNSASPSAILSVDGLDEVCQGSLTPKQLSIADGRLGLRAQWVWYKDNISPQSLIKRGVSQIDVTPNKTTTYIVRAEGPVNITMPVSFTLKVLSPSDPPTAIKISPLGPVCEGAPLQLSVIGGRLGEGAKWEWEAKNSYTTYSLGNESTVTDNPEKSMTYSVHATSACKTSNSVTTQVIVKSKSVNPNFSQVTTNPIRRKSGSHGVLKYQVINNGGYLGEGAKWVWYDDPELRSKVVSGSEYLSTSKKPTQVFLRAEGDCNDTEPMMFSINGIDKRKSVTKHSKLKFGFINAGWYTSKVDTFNIPSVFLAIGSQNFYIKGSFSSPIMDLVGNKSADLKNPPYLHEGNVITNYPTNSGSYYNFNGFYHNKLESYTAGFMAGRKWAKVYFGAGYGTYKSLLGVSIYDSISNQFVKNTWSQNSSKSFSGPCAEAGLFFKMSWLNMSFGVSHIMSVDGKKAFTTGQLGLGLSF